MSRKIKREPSRQFSISLPLELLEEVETICALNFISRSSWMFMAAKEKIERDREKKKGELIDKLSKELINNI
jgi:metal-responsive CopG/Arc/MetJ family transcriptional regulator